MKLLLWILAIVTALVLTIYTLVFTAFGNAIVAPYIESQIQENTHMPSKLSTFELRISSLNIVLELNEQNKISLFGEYSLFTQAFSIRYDVALENLTTLEPLTQTPLHGTFFTDGVVQGDMKKISLNGKSNVASSQTSYSATLVDMQPQTLIASIKDAKIEELLAMVVQPKFATALLNLDIAFTSLDMQNLQGDASIVLSQGNINTQIMKEKYGVTLGKTTFTSKTTAKLQAKDVIYKTELVSNLANISSKGTIQPQTLGMKLSYALNIAELAVLKPLTNAPLRGSFNLKGEVSGNKEHLVVNGLSDLAGSETTFEATLKEFAPASVVADIKNLQLAKLLYMLEQPHYTDGLFSMQARVEDARMESLKGKVTTRLSRGELDAPFITKLSGFASPMPRTTYEMQSTTLLNGNIADTQVTLESNLASLHIKSAKFNIKDASLQSDYSATLPDLDKLFFATQRHLKGSLIANGTLKKAKDLDFTLSSGVAGGKIEAKLHNDDFHADIIAIQTLDALKMLIYPELFKATLNAQLDYNLALQKGVFKGKLLEGVFTKNQIFDLIKQYAQTDMYKELFSGDVHAMINQEKITASLDLRSNTSSIVTKDAKLNSKTQQVDADIDLVFNKNPISASVKGDMSAPKVSVDLQKFMQSKAGQKVQEKATKLFKKLF